MGLVEVEIPGPSVSGIIGLSGCNIRRLQELFNVKMVFLGHNTETYDHRTLRITGPQKDIDIAKKKVLELCDLKIGLNDDIRDMLDMSKPAATSPPALHLREFRGSAEVSDECLVPTSVVGSVIGANGENLRTFKSAYSLTYLEMEGVRVSEEGREMRRIVMKGLPNNVDMAKTGIIRLIEASAPTKVDVFRGNDSAGDFLAQKRSAAATNGRRRHDSSGSESVESLRERTAKLINLQPLQQSVDISLDDLFVPPAPSASVAHRSSTSPKPARVAQLIECITELCRTNAENVVKKIVEFVEMADSGKQKEMVCLESQLDTHQKANAALESEINELKKQVRARDLKLESLRVENDKMRDEKFNVENEMKKLKLTSQMDAVTGFPKCKSCNENLRNVVFMTCLHFTHCKPCSEKLRDCPICKVKIDSRLKIKLDVPKTTGNYAR